MSDFESARDRHQAGDLHEADRLYQRVLAANPIHADALHLRGVVCLQQGNHESAVALIEQAVNHAPHNTDYHNNLGEAYRLSGKLPQAENSFRRAIALDSQQPDAYGNLGLVLRERGEMHLAIDCFRMALSLNPNFVEAAMNLGTSLRELGERALAMAVFKEAVRIFPTRVEPCIGYGTCLLDSEKFSTAVSFLEAAIERFPDDSKILLALGEACVNLGDLEKAAGWVQAAVTHDACDAHAHYLLADIYAMQERLDEAEATLRIALSLVPDKVEYLNLKGWILRTEGRLDESLSVLEHALVLGPEDISVINNRARTLLALGDDDEALCELRRSLEAQAERADTHNALGNCLIARGDSEQAVVHLRKALAVNPRLVGAWESLARAKKFSNQDREEIARLEALAQCDNLTEPMKISIHHALGKMEDDCGSYTRAFFHYRQANEIRGKSLSFDPDVHAHQITRRIAVFDRALFEAKKNLGSTSDVPIFIVGMLRSGTTLVEQILSSHSQIHGAGELSLFTNIQVSGQTANSPTREYMDGIEVLSASNVKQLAREYLFHLTRSGGQCLRATDKMPNNYLHLGLIALLFPRARVVHCRRNPLDNGLSIFFQHLGVLNPYACDLNAIGRYYREYLRLMEHWKAVLPITIHEVEYEDLVSDQEPVTRDLIEYCGVDWEASCLDYHLSKRAVLTPSDWQVHQPIYTGAIERWKRYSAHIGPLKAGLAGKSG